jgi:hypothetical protein
VKRTCSFTTTTATTTTHDTKRAHAPPLPSDKRLSVMSSPHWNFLGSSTFFRALQP